MVMLRRGFTFGIILLLVFSSFTIFPAQDVVSVSKEEIEDAIEKGISWLANKQNKDGSWCNYYRYYISCTGLVLTKLQEFAWEQDLSPFDNNYKYKDNVVNGWKFLFSSYNESNGNGSRDSSYFIHKTSISVQYHNGILDDPDTRKNGYGLFFDNSAYPTYSTGICLMALAASGTPNRKNEGGFDFDNDSKVDTYFEIAQDIVDYFAFSQGDKGNDNGGWGYSPLNNSSGTTDNSNSGYAVLGLAAAEEFGCVIPQWVKTKLSIWINYVQDPVDYDSNGYDGGSWYNPDGYSSYYPCQLKTGNLIFELTFCGNDTTDERFKAALDYIERHWRDNNTYPGWGYNIDPSVYQAMFCLMKGLVYSGIEKLDLNNDSIPEHDWFDDFASVLLTQQNQNGSWPKSKRSDPLLILSTTWSLLSLEKYFPPQKPKPDVKPPIANAGGPYVSFEGSIINFDASLSYDPDNMELEYRWDFNGDGNWDTNFSKYPNATYTYGDNWVDFAFVEVLKENYTGHSPVIEKALVNVKNVAPTIQAPNQISVLKNETVSLFANVTDPGSDDICIEWYWGFGGIENNRSIYLNNPPNIDPYPSFEENPRMINDTVCCNFSRNGTFRVVIIATDDDGASCIRNITIDVEEPKIESPPKEPPEEPETKEPPVEKPNIPPIAYLSAYPISGIVPLEVNFYGTGFDKDGNITSLEWDFGDGYIFKDNMENLSNYSYGIPINVYDIPGIYTVTLIVTDDDNATDFDFITIVVKEPPPVEKTTFKITGFVYKANTKLKIAHAKVTTAEVDILTDHVGFYSITVPNGTYLLNVTKSGYEPAFTKITVTNDINLDFYLKPIPKAKIQNDKEKSVEYPWIWIYILITIVLGMAIAYFVSKKARRSKQPIEYMKSESKKSNLKK